MNANQACDILGTSAHGVPFTNMIKALQMCSAMNTAEENKRLEAALWVRRNRRAYDVECGARRARKIIYR